MEGLGITGSPVVVSAGVRGEYSGSIRPMTSRQALAASGSHGTGPVCSQVLEHFQVSHGLQNKGKGHWEAGGSHAQDIYSYDLSRTFIDYLSLGLTMEGTNILPSP